MPKVPKIYTRTVATTLTHEQYVRLLEAQKPGEQISSALRRLLDERFAAREAERAQKETTSGEI